MANNTQKTLIEEIRKEYPGLGIWYNEENNQIMLAIDPDKLDLPSTIEVSAGKIKQGDYEADLIIYDRDKTSSFTEAPKPKVNELLSEFLNKEIGKLITKRTKRTGEESVDKGNNIIILKEDEEKYDALMQLKNLLDTDCVLTKDHKSNEIYDLKCKVKMGRDGFKTTEFKISSDGLKTLIGILPKLESLGITKYLQIPNEVYQVAKGNAMPNTNDLAPAPKRMSESEEEYEDRLKREGKVVGEPTINQNSNIRSPYLHEKIDYRQDPPTIQTTGTPSEYYNEYVRNQHDRNLGRTEGNTPTSPLSNSDEQVVTDSDERTKSRLRDKFKAFRNNLKDKDKLNLALQIAAGVAIAGVTIAIAPHALPILGSAIKGIPLIPAALVHTLTGTATVAETMATLSVLFAGGTIAYALRKRAKAKKEARERIKEEQENNPETPEEAQPISFDADSAKEMLLAAFKEKEETDKLVAYYETLKKAYEFKKTTPDKDEAKNKIADMLVKLGSVLSVEEMGNLTSSINEYDSLASEQIEERIKKTQTELGRLYQVQKTQLEKIKQILNNIKTNNMTIPQGGVAHAI